MSDQRWKFAFRSQCLVVAILLGVLAHVGPKTTEAQGQGGNLPQAVDLNPQRNILETNLVAEEAKVDLGNGLVAKGVTFNGAIPGPELRLKVGDRVIVHFTNKLPEGFTIHWHGIELNNGSDGTGLTQNAVKTNETFDYKFVVPRPGIYFYHSHIEPTNPEFKGYFGPIIVEDPAEDKLRAKNILPDRRNTFTLVLSDTTVCKAAGSNDAATFPADAALPWVGTEELSGSPPFPGLLAERTPVSMCEAPIDNFGRFVVPAVPLEAGAIPNIQPSHDNPQCAAGCRVNEGQIVLTNGKITAPRAGSPANPGALGDGGNIFDIKEGTGVRLQLASATATRYIRLRMTDQNGQMVTLFRVGGQGGLLDRVRVEGGVLGTFNTLYNEGEILLGASERSDVVFTMPQGKNGDIVTLWTQDYQRIGGGVLQLWLLRASHSPGGSLPHRRRESREHSVQDRRKRPAAPRSVRQQAGREHQGTHSDSADQPGNPRSPATGYDKSDHQVDDAWASSHRSGGRFSLRCGRSRFHTDTPYCDEPLRHGRYGHRADHREHQCCTPSLALPRILDATDSNQQMRSRLHQ